MDDGGDGDGDDNGTVLQSHHLLIDELHIQHSMGGTVTPLLLLLKLQPRFNPFISAVQLSPFSQFSVV